MTNTELLDILNQKSFDDLLAFGTGGFFVGFSLGMIIVNVLIKHITKLQSQICELQISHRHRNIGTFGLMVGKAKAVLS